MNTFRHCHFYLFALPQQPITRRARVVVLGDEQHSTQPVQALAFELGDTNNPWHLREHTLPVCYAPAWASRCVLRLAMEDGGDSPPAAEVARALLYLLCACEDAPADACAVLSRVGRTTVLTLLSTPLACLFDAPAVQDWLGASPAQQAIWGEARPRKLLQRVQESVRALPFDPGLQLFASHAMQLGATLHRIDTPAAKQLRSLLSVTCWPATAARAHEFLDDWQGPADVRALWLADRLDSFTSSLDGLLPGLMRDSAQARRAWLATLPAMLQALPQPRITPWLRRLAAELSLQGDERDIFAQASRCMLECWAALGRAPAARAGASELLALCQPDTPRAANLQPLAAT